MENEMIIMRKADFTDLITELRTLNNNFKNLNLNKEEDKFFTRDEAQEYYNLSKREVDKIFNNLLRNKVVNIGKNTRLAKSHIDDLFKQGVVSK